MAVTNISSSVPGLSGVGFGTSISCAAPTLLASGDLVTITIRYQTNISVAVLNVQDNFGNPATFYGTCINSAATGATKGFDIYYIVANGSETQYTVSYDVSTFNSIEAAGWRSSKGGTPTIVNSFVNRENALAGPYLWDAPVDEISNGDCVLMFWFGNNETRMFTAPTGGSSDPIAIMYEEETANNRELWFQTQSSQQFIPGYSTTIGGSPIYTSSTLMILRDTDPTPPPFVAALDPSKAGARNVISALPPPRTGYQLDAPWSFWSSILPRESTNLVNNPSFEYTRTSGIVSSGWTTLTGSVENSSRDFYHLRASGPSGSAAYVGPEFYAANSGVYAFSVDVYHITGQQFSLEFRPQSSTTTLAIKSYTALYTGWGRYSVIDSLTGSATYWALVTSTESGDPIRIDGLMVEEIKESTTYFDGDQVDGSFNAKFMYNWKGVKGFSNSTRSNKTRSGGKIVSWAQDALFRTTVIQGLDLPDADVELPILSGGNEILSNRNPIGRDIRIIGRIYGCSKQEMKKRASEFIRLLKPQNDKSTQRTIIKFEPVLDSGESYGKPLFMYVTNISGVTGNYTNWFQEEFGVDFRLSDPRLYEEFGTSTEIPYDNLTGVSLYVAERNAITGIWSDLPDSGSTSSAGTVFCRTIEHVGNNIYVGGEFTTFAGVSAARIAYRDHITESWSQADAGLNDDVYDISFAPENDDSVYICGAFTQNGSGAGTIRRIALYIASLDIITELDNGLDDIARTMAAHPSGIFIGGDFVQDAIASTTFNHIALYEFSSNSIIAIDAGVNNDVNVALVGPDNNLYIGGIFTTAGSLAITANNVAMWNTSTNTWSQVGQGLTGGVNTLAFDQNGVLYAGGSFTTDGNGNFMTSLAKFNGVSWQGVFPEETIPLSTITELFFDRDNAMYISALTNLSGDIVPDYINGSAAKIINGTWINADFLTDAGYPDDYSLSNEGDLAVAISLNPWGSDGNITNGKTIDYQGTADAPVKILIEGSGKPVEIRNWTIGKSIYFKSEELVLNDEERLVIDLTNPSAKIFTNQRGDVSRFIVGGLSDLNEFRLVPGDNHITCSIREDTTANTKCVISWRNAHWSMSEAYV
jgi:hypothetical protein